MNIILQPSTEILVIDACAFINLANSQHLDAVLQLKQFDYVIGPIVKSEVGSHLDDFERNVAAGLIKELSGADVSALTFLDLLSKYNLGEGETECIAFGHTSGCCVASDDLAARRAVSSELGLDKLTGSVGLLRQCVQAGILTPAAAYDGYLLMVQNGAFLPKLPPPFFHSN